MGYLDQFKEHAELVANNGNLTHDLLAAAAAYEAAKMYENHRAENGQPDSHAQAKELLYVFVFGDPDQG
ncbi:hypothetical protein ID866_10040 [Astraeus odoratus]|nr:hypothetical protein ID866_10040 [Astraeus odoratus]